MPQADRKSRACVTCFDKKLKCDRENPCSVCIKRNTTCLYLHVEKARKTRQRNATRIKEMETRLRAMESLINSANQAGGQDPAAQQSNTEVDTDSIACDEAHEQLDEMEEFSAVRVLDGGLPSTRWTVIKHQGPSRQLVKRSLPNAEEVQSLLKEYFESFNTIFPLFGEDDIIEIHQSAAEPLADLSRWATLNIALAIACRMRGMRTLQCIEQNSKAFRYIQNALNVAQDLTLRKPDLPSVQALLGIAIVLQSTPNPRPASIIVAAAVKLSQSLGLNRQNSFVGLSDLQAEQRKRIFWIAYMLDKDFSLQLNHPPVQTDLDCDIDLPAEDPVDGLGVITLSNGQGKINIFRLRTQLAIIQNKTYTTLYSVQSSKLSPSARSLAIENLDNCLNAWKRSIPMSFAPETLLQSVSPGAILHLVILYATYFDCLTMIHSISLRGEYWSASASDTIEGTLAGDPVSVGRTLCLPAARLAVALMGLLPRGDYACIWLLLHYYVSALVILLANIIQHPRDESAHTDMELIEPLLRLLEFLSISGEMGGDEDLSKLQKFCLNLEQEARTALGDARFALQQSESITASLLTSTGLFN